MNDTYHSPSNHKTNISTLSVSKLRIDNIGVLERGQCSESQEYMYSVLSNFYSKYVNGNRNSRGIKLTGPL